MVAGTRTKSRQEINRSWAREGSELTGGRSIVTVTVRLSVYALGLLMPTGSFHDFHYQTQDQVSKADCWVNPYYLVNNWSSRNLSNFPSEFFWMSFFITNLLNFKLLENFFRRLIFSCLSHGGVSWARMQAAVRLHSSGAEANEAQWTYGRIRPKSLRRQLADGPWRQGPPFPSST